MGLIMVNPLLRIEGLHTYFSTEDGIVKAVNGLDLTLAEGETLGLVGESGCGKSVTALSIMRLVQQPAGRIVRGRIFFEDNDLAFHCGTTQNGSNLNGMLEALELAGSNRLHVCHITAYCRGLTHGSPVTETMIALEALSDRPHLVSESHNGPYNGTGASLENDVPRSHVTRTCLEAGGYEVSAEGMLSAAKKGYMRVQKPTAREVIYLEPADGVIYMKKMNFDVTVSFPVNRRSTAFLTATEKNDQGRFVVTALSTDGGGIPRNFLLSHGLSLVRFDALTLADFVHKCCWAPARMLGLSNKGHLAPGADGDVVVADPNSYQAVLTVAGGKVIMLDGIVIGSGGTIVTTERGVKALKDQGIPAEVSNLADSLLYTAPSG
jgi:energy-coupling factor transporter ATP-binding protein EcfA2